MPLCRNLFQDIQVKRIVQSSDGNEMPGCPACSTNALNATQTRTCALLTYVCEKLTLAKQHGHRVFLYGASGSGKTRAVNCHFNGERTFLPSSCSTFSFDGFDARLHTCIFFDEYQVSNQSFKNNSTIYSYIKLFCASY